MTETPTTDALGFTREWQQFAASDRYLAVQIILRRDDLGGTCEAMFKSFCKTFYQSGILAGLKKAESVMGERGFK